MNSKISNYLKDIYFDPNHAGSYGGADQLYKVVKEEGLHQISKARIKAWLSQFNAYTENRPVKQKFKTLKLISPYINFQWDCDTASYTFLAKYNNGYKYIAVFCDLLSRFLITRPLKTLTGREMKSVMEEVFIQQQPSNIRSDAGTEYQNKTVKDYLSDQNIKHIVTRNSQKASLAERNIKNLRKRFAIYMSHNNTYNWVDQLQAVTNSINHSINRNLGISPATAVTLDSVTLWQMQHKFKKDKKIIVKKEKKKNPKKLPYTKSIYPFKLNDTVKLSRMKSKFHRELDENFTKENFIIADRFQKQGIPLFIVKDSQNRRITGTFYKDELVPVTIPENDDTFYKVEKILKTRRYKGRTQKLVKWQNYGSEFNSWINNSDLKDIE